MRRLHTKVNLIPIIAKADTMTEEEILHFKQRILSDIAYHRIEIYQAPRYENEDEESLIENEEIVVGLSSSAFLSVLLTSHYYVLVEKDSFCSSRINDSSFNFFRSSS